MEYFSSTRGDQVSQFCFGCEALGGTDWGNVTIDSVSEAITVAVELGVNFFDTADVYGLGLSEFRLAEVLGQKRHELFIATKVGVRWNPPQSGSRAQVWIDNNPEYLKKAVSSSLHRLRLDSIPVGYLHWPGKSGDVRPAVESLAKMRDDGLLGHVGLSNLSVSQLRDALSVSDIDFLQMPCNILNMTLDAEILDLCKKNAVSVVVYNVLASGLLCGKFDEHTKFGSNDRRSRQPDFNGVGFKNNLAKVSRIKQLANAQRLDCRAYAIREVARNRLISACILGCTSATQTFENIDVFK